MKFIRHPTIDWEPAALRISFCRTVVGAEEKLRDLWPYWFQLRGQQRICDCFEKFTAIRSIDSRAIELHSEWLCEKCLPVLREQISATFPEAESLEFGYPSADRSQAGQQFLQIEAQEVTLENGRPCHVPRFEISRLPISVGDFAKFVDETGHVTVTARNGEIESFRENDQLRAMSPSERECCPALMLSYLDAVAYCAWVNMRLPSEEEVVVAASADHVEHLSVTDEMRRQVHQMIESGRIIEGGAKLTGTLSNDMVIVRRGPFPFRLSNWRTKAPKYRLLRERDNYDHVTEFHVCKLLR
jgi:hypothetical protein